MAKIDLTKVCVDFPIYNANGRSLKKRLLQVATGGQIGADERGRVIVRALDGITLSLRDGDRLGLIGHNGAGKSSFLRVLTGVYAPSAGSAAIEGVVGSLIDISLGIDPEATGKENIFVRGQLLGMSKAQIAANLDEIVDFSELGDFIDMPVRTYSTGMHMRLAFSVSTTLRPEILVMDEWLSVGDAAFAEKAEARLARMVQDTNILVVATHSKALVTRLCSHVVWLEHGRVRTQGSADEVCPLYFGA